MDDFTLYRIYLATKLHFTTESYSVFETNGRVKGLTREAYATKKGTGVFKMLAKKLDNPQEAVQFCVAQAVYGEPADVFDMPKAFDQFAKWKGFKESCTYKIKTEMNGVFVRETDLQGRPPELIRHIVAGRISPQTGVAIQRHTNFLLSADLSEHLLYQKTGLKLRKLDRFVKYDEAEINAKIDDTYLKSN